MILPFALALLQTQRAEVLVVDGFAIGMHTESGWQKASPSQGPINVGLSRIGLVGADGAASNVKLTANADGTALIAQGGMSGVFFSGKVWTPRQAKPGLDRSSAMATVAQFARDRGIPQPRPYLIQVLDVDLEGAGRSVELISAASKPPVRSGLSGPGGWEAVLLRWRSGGQIRFLPLTSSFPKNGEVLAQCRLRAVADFDGDGTLEFVTTSSRAFYMNATLWTFTQGKPTTILDVTYEVTS